MSAAHGHGPAHPAPAHPAPAAGGHGEPGVSHFGEEAIQTLTEAVAESTASGSRNPALLAFARWMKGFPGGRTALLVAIPGITIPFARRITGLLPLDLATKAYLSDLLENTATGGLRGLVTAMDDLTVEEIAERLEAGAAAHAAGHTAAVAAGVPSAQRFIGVFGIAADRLIHRANLTPAGALDVYPPRTHVKDDPVVPRANCVGYSEAYGRHWLLHPLEDSTDTVAPPRPAAGARGGRDAAPIRTTMKVVRTPFDVRQMDIEEAMRLTTSNELRWCPVCFPDPAREIAEARAAKARGGDASHGTHGDAHEAPATPRKSLLQLAHAGGHTNIVRVMNGITRIKLNTGQVILRDEFYGDIERSGISEDLLELLNGFCGDISDPPTSDEVDHFLEWLNVNVPGVDESVASTWRGWLWQQRRKVARYWGYALLGLVIAIALVVALIFGAPRLIGFLVIKLVTLITTVWDQFAIVTGLKSVLFWLGMGATETYGGWAARAFQQIFVDMTHGNTWGVLSGSLVIYLLAILLGNLGQIVVDRFRAINPLNPEPIRNLGRDTSNGALAFAGLHTAFVWVFGTDPVVTTYVVGSVIALSVSVRFSMRSIGAMEATLRDITRRTGLFIVGPLVTLVTVTFVLKTWFPNVAVKFVAGVDQVFDVAAMPIVALAIVGVIVLALSSREGVTAEDRKGYATFGGWAATLILILALTTPTISIVKDVVGSTYHGVTESMANGWTHFLNPSGSWKSSPTPAATAPKPKAAGAAPAAPVIKAPAVAAPVLVAPTQAPPAHSPAPAPAAAPTPTNPLLKRFCDGLGSVQRSQTPACKGI